MFLLASKNKNPPTSPTLDGTSTWDTAQFVESDEDQPTSSKISETSKLNPPNYYTSHGLEAPGITLPKPFDIPPLTYHPVQLVLPMPWGSRGLEYSVFFFLNDVLFTVPNLLLAPSEDTNSSLIPETLPPSNKLGATPPQRAPDHSQPPNPTPPSSPDMEAINNEIHCVLCKFIITDEDELRHCQTCKKTFHERCLQGECPLCSCDWCGRPIQPQSLVSCDSCGLFYHKDEGCFKIRKHVCLQCDSSSSDEDQPAQTNPANSLKPPNNNCWECGELIKPSEKPFPCFSCKKPIHILCFREGVLDCRICSPDCRCCQELILKQDLAVCVSCHGKVHNEESCINIETLVCLCCTGAILPSTFEPHPTANPVSGFTDTSPSTQPGASNPANLGEGEVLPPSRLPSPHNHPTQPQSSATNPSSGAVSSAVPQPGASNPANLGEGGVLPPSGLRSPRNYPKHRQPPGSRPEKPVNADAQVAQRRKCDEIDRRFKCPCLGCKSPGFLSIAKALQHYRTNHSTNTPPIIEFLPKWAQKPHLCGDHSVSGQCRTCSFIAVQIEEANRTLKEVRKVIPKKMLTRISFGLKKMEQVIDPVSGEPKKLKKGWKNLGTPERKIGRLLELEKKFNEQLDELNSKYKGTQDKESIYPETWIDVCRAWLELDATSFFEVTCEASDVDGDVMLQKIRSYDNWASKMEKDPDLIYLLKNSINLSHRGYRDLLTAQKGDPFQGYPLSIDVSFNRHPPVLLPTLPITFFFFMDQNCLNSSYFLTVA